MKDQEDKVMKQEDRKKFDFLENDPVGRIEGTTEYPVMYHALGTEPRTEHPFNVYNDIKATEAGTIKEITASEGRAVEYDQVLFKLEII